jgi:replicative DNA helicase
VNRERIPPHNLDAEASLLGTLLLSREAWASIDGLNAADFYKPAHQWVFEVMRRQNAAGGHADVVTVADELRCSDPLDQVGGPTALYELQQAPPAISNAGRYARIVAETGFLRRVIGTSSDIAALAYDEPNDVSAVAQHAATQIAALVDQASSLAIVRQRGLPGGDFVLDQPEVAPAVWGSGEDVLWAKGEGCLIVGPTGVGKTTFLTQLTAARIGLGDGTVIGFPVERSDEIVLYLACDRPDQAARAMRRLVTDDDRPLMNERLRFWKGPPPADFGRHPEALLRLCVEHHATTVVIDSLKDVAVKLSDDEVGGHLNQAIQLALVNGVDVLAGHHQRTGQGGAKPKTLEDVYGSTWIVAGVGSVVLLWGAAGDPIVELLHLKQPVAEVGPFKIEHDQQTGVSSISDGVDVLDFIRRRPRGVTAGEIARLLNGGGDPSDNQRKKAQRRLERMLAQGLLHRLDTFSRGGPQGSIPNHYVAVDDRREPPR